MQLRMDAADRLVELVEERRTPVPALDAARELFALARPPVGLARSLLDEVVSGDARLRWLGSAVGLAGEEAHDVPLEAASFVVVDLETTGLSARTDEICEIGAVRVRGLEPVATFQTLARPRAPLPPAVAALTGIDRRDLARAPGVDAAVARFLRFAGDCVLVAHNARFDVAFLDRALERTQGRRLAAPVLDTVPLARRLLGDRVARTSLGALAHFYGTSVEPCHRALPDAQATAEILVALIGAAQERGARTVRDLLELGVPRARRAHGKRSLAFGAPRRPGVYLFRDRNDTVLYVGKARDLRARLRSYFGSERLRPAVEAAVGAAEAIEWRVLGSEVEAALEELRLIRELRPPANARGTRPERSVYLARRDGGVALTSEPTPMGPVWSRRRAELALRALRGATDAELDGLVDGAPLPRVRERLAALSDAQRYEDAARLRDRLHALERLVHELRELERLRRLEACILAPALETGFVRALAVRGGRMAATRKLSVQGGAAVEVDALLAEAARSPRSATLAADAVDELRLVDGALRRPAPELAVLPLDRDAIVAALPAHRAHASAA